MKKKEKYIIYLSFSITRVSFLFGDYILGNTKNINTAQVQIPKSSISNSINNNISKQESYNEKISETQTSKNNNITTKQELKEFNLTSKEISKLDIESLQNNDSEKILDDINSLKTIYKETKNVDVLGVLLQKFVENYQFQDALTYINALDNGKYPKEIDPKLYLHIVLNSLSISKSGSIAYFEDRLEELNNKGIISQIDYIFYKGLTRIRRKDFEGARVLYEKSQNNQYQYFIGKFLTTLEDTSKQKDIPGYYREAMVALSLLKNGYFSIAKKLALDIAIKNEEYILPYQILAYSHFLTNNRDSAIDYFLKLTEIDSTKENNYKFMIGVSYYRAKKHEESVLYLSQIKNNIYVSDSNRYLILNYIAGEDINKLIRTRQLLLGQNNLQKSDFYTFFYETFYKPFKYQVISEIYKNNQQLAISFIERCYDILDESNQDICVYGEAGLDIYSSNWERAKNKLLQLSEKYPSSYIFHALGDYYLRQRDTNIAKQYYIKAISITDSTTEKNIIKKKLIE